MSRRLPPLTATDAKRARRAGRRDFARLVAQAEPAQDADLPLTHITDGYRFRGITEEGALNPTDCKVFDEPLLYLFHGRPAYRVNGAGGSSGLDAYWPICFLIKPAGIVPKRIYPFDTGAFERKLFADYCHQDMIAQDFELESDASMPARLISLFWGDPRSYFDNRDAALTKPGPFDFEAKSYSELIRAKANAPFDERHSAIELQIDAPVPLKDNLLAVILPSDFATPETLAKYHARGALVLPFDTVNRHDAANMVGQIYDICRDLYAGKRDGRVRYW